MNDILLYLISPNFLMTTKVMRKTMKIVMTMTQKVGTKPMRMRMRRERTTMVMPVPDLLLVDYLWFAHWFFGWNMKINIACILYDGHTLKRIYEMLLTFSWPISVRQRFKLWSGISPNDNSPSRPRWSIWTLTRYSCVSARRLCENLILVYHFSCGTTMAL